MRQYLVKIVILSIVVASSISLVFFQADEKTDAFYKRFTTPKQSSLILGSSRAAQGVMPSVLNKELDNTAFYNYSFTFNTSPYGPTYFNSIDKKLDKTTNKNKFIITVDPWVISSCGANPNDSLLFEETESFIAKTSKVNQNPNFLYLIKGYDDLYVKILFNKSPYVLHDDGWLEVKVDVTDKQMRESLIKTETDYIKKLSEYRFSQARLSYLTKTIQYLQKHGTVYLVRLPIHPKIQVIETQLMPDFDKKMLKISNQLSVNYFNLQYDSLKHVYNDGQHLKVTSAEIVSEQIADLIKQDIKGTTAKN